MEDFEEGFVGFRFVGEAFFYGCYVVYGVVEFDGLAGGLVGGGGRGLGLLGGGDRGGGGGCGGFFWDFFADGAGAEDAGDACGVGEGERAKQAMLEEEEWGGGRERKDLFYSHSPVCPGA